MRQASLGRDVAGTMRTVVAQDLAVAVTQAYGAVLAAEAATRAADAAVEAATADLTLAQNRRDAGVATDADVLRIEVYLARTREQRIRSGADVTIARARLNQVLGEPLDTIVRVQRVQMRDRAPSYYLGTSFVDAARPGAARIGELMRTLRAASAPGAAA